MATITPTLNTNPTTMAANWSKGVAANAQKWLAKYLAPKALFNANPTQSQAAWTAGIAAAQARNLWFAPLAPQTRYTVDVVAGPLPTGRGDTHIQADGSGGLSAIYGATDAIGALAALQAFLTREDALTSLQRVQFTTSRYATFSD